LLRSAAAASALSKAPTTAELAARRPYRDPAVELGEDALLTRRVREASFEKKRASVAVIRQQYREKLEREKDAIAGHMQGLKDAYAALWTLHSTCKDDINRLETTVRGLEGQVKYMTEDHKRQIKQINDENQVRVPCVTFARVCGME
jgi:chromosome segregation ATPase